MEELARDPNVDKMIRAHGKGTAKTLKRIWNIYFAGRFRLFHALVFATRCSFGVREEHRLAFTFINKLKAYLEKASN